MIARGVSGGSIARRFDQGLIFRRTFYEWHRANFCFGLRILLREEDTTPAFFVRSFAYIDVVPNSFVLVMQRRLSEILIILWTRNRFDPFPNFRPLSRRIVYHTVDLHSFVTLETALRATACGRRRRFPSHPDLNPSLAKHIALLHVSNIGYLHIYLMNIVAH
jgi:hypothetical protein